MNILFYIPLLFGNRISVHIGKLRRTSKITVDDIFDKDALNAPIILSKNLDECIKRLDFTIEQAKKLKKL